MDVETSRFKIVENDQLTMLNSIGVMFCVKMDRLEFLGCSQKCTFIIQWSVFAPASSTVGCTQTKFINVWTHYNDGQTNNSIHPRN